MRRNGVSDVAGVRADESVDPVDVEQKVDSPNGVLSGLAAVGKDQLNLISQDTTRSVDLCGGDDSRRFARWCPHAGRATTGMQQSDFHKRLACSCHRTSGTDHSYFDY